VMTASLASRDCGAAADGLRRLTWTQTHQASGA
jgi:hypothetical protein